MINALTGSNVYQLSITHGDQTKTLKLLRTIDWVDFGGSGTEQLKALVQHRTDLRGDNKKVLTHCTAGVGRTGTVIAADKMLNTRDRFQGCNRIRPKHER